MMLYLRVVPGFWITVEECRRPELRSLPLIIGGLPQQRGIVREANFPAQRFGVRVGMTLSQAHQYCPSGIFLAPDLPRYEAVWEAVCDILWSCTPLVEPVEMGQAVCDLSGCERRWTDVGSAAYAITSQIQGATGITPWLGVASNRLVAQLASTTVGADGITVVDRGQERAFLAPLPITLLPDVDPHLALTFQVLGLRTIGQLAALPAPAVKQRFGVTGERLHRYARGIDSRSVTPPPPRPSVAARYECEDGSLEEAGVALHRLADTCAAELQHRHLAGRLVELILWWESPLTPLPPLPCMGEGEPRTLCSLHASFSPSPALRERGVGGEGRFPISYRVHSMLPQPASRLEPARRRAYAIRPYGEAEGVCRSTINRDPTLQGAEGVCRSTINRDPTLRGGRGRMQYAPTDAAPDHIRKASVAVRTSINTAPPLLEQAQRLLLRSYPRRPSIHRGDRHPDRRRLRAIELTVSEFEAPAQLSFAELGRLDQTGLLGGISPVRRQVLAEQEQLLAARHGEAPFHHVADVDSGNLLTERRFRWKAGLPWWKP